LAIGAYLNVQFSSVDPKLAAVGAYVVFMALNIVGCASPRRSSWSSLDRHFELLVFMGVVSRAFQWPTSPRAAGRDSFSLAAIPGIFTAIRSRSGFSGHRGCGDGGEWDPKRSIPAYITGILTLVLAIGVMLFAGGAGDWTKLANINDAPKP
jgi:ethanolamine permease